MKETISKYQPEFVMEVINIFYFLNFIIEQLSLIIDKEKENYFFNAIIEKEFYLKANELVQIRKLFLEMEKKLEDDDWLEIITLNELTNIFNSLQEIQLFIMTLESQSGQNEEFGSIY